jgi:hypothetical protein
MNAAAAASIAPVPPRTLTAAPVNCAGLDGTAEVGDMGIPPVGLTEAVALGAVYGAPMSMGLKLAQPMRVLLFKCTTKDRLPKYDGSSLRVAE